MSETNDAQKCLSRWMKPAITIVTLAAVAVFMFVGSVKAQFGDANLTLGATLSGSTTISYEDIQSATLAENLDAGRRTLGIGNLVMNAGRFQNSDYGSYTLYAYKSCTTYIVVRTADGVAVFNRKDAAQTKELYEQLQQKLVHAPTEL